jgi:hypothetical protein
MTLAFATVAGASVLLWVAAALAAVALVVLATPGDDRVGLLLCAIALLLALLSLITGS